MIPFKFQRKKQADTMRMRWVWKGFLLGVVLLTTQVMSAHAQVVRSQEMNVQYHRAETAWKSGASVLEVKTRIDRVLKALPDDVEALKLRAQVLLKLDRVAEALADVQRAVALSSKDGEAHLILCEAARRNGDTALRSSRPSWVGVRWRIRTWLKSPAI